MPLTLELPPEVEARLLEEATQRSLSASEVVTLLVQGYFWPAESSLLQEWYRQESRREVFALKRRQADINFREQIVEAVTQEKNLQAQIAHEERAIARCRGESILAAQKAEHEEALKAYQTMVLHEQRLGELKGRLPDVAAKAQKLLAELRDREQDVSISIIEATRMKLQRIRADILLGKPAAQHCVEYDLESKIRAYASESVWNAQYEDWIAAHQNTVHEEVPSEIEVMQQVGEQNQRFLEANLKRIAELQATVRPSGGDAD